ncbi:Flp pilus assembly protein CpaB [Flindersiella endophytica]
MLRRILFTAIAVILAAAGTAGVGLYAKSADARALRGQEVVEAYVAAKTVPVGTSAEAARAGGLIKTEQLARRTVPVGALTTIGSDVEKLVASVQIPAGSLVMKSVFAAPEAVNRTGLVIPKGKIAVSVKLEDPARVAGLVQPGAEVAVFDTFTIWEGKDRKGNNPTGENLGSDKADVHTTRVVVAKATVLAIGQTTAQATQGDTKDKDSKQSGGLTKSAAGAAQTSMLVTLALTQAEAERLITVAQSGKPWLALLGDGSKVTNGPGVRTRDLFTYGGAQ